VNGKRPEPVLLREVSYIRAVNTTADAYYTIVVALLARCFYPLQKSFKSALPLIASGKPGLRDAVVGSAMIANSGSSFVSRIQRLQI